MGERVEVIDVVTAALYVLTGLPNCVRYIDPLVAGAHTPAANPACVHPRRKPGNSCDLGGTWDDSSVVSTNTDGTVVGARF